MRIITRKRITRAVDDVRRELVNLGLFSEQLDTSEIYLTWAGPYCACMGSDGFGMRAGDIVIPRVGVYSIPWTKQVKSLRAYMRHEYGHAFAEKHPKLVKTPMFEKLFRGKYDSDRKHRFLPIEFITEYAAKNPAEDFAETFTEYVTMKGQIAGYKAIPRIYKKLCFVGNLRKGLNL